MTTKHVFLALMFGMAGSQPQQAFEYIVEPAVRESTLECIRADKNIHSTVTDKPMYEQLLDADLVIAYLSTSNANAIYELGVRHALRPHTTIVMAEGNSLCFPG